MDFTNILKAISPQRGLAMLKVGIEKSLEKSIESFNLIYSNKDEVILLQYDGKTIEYKSANSSLIVFTVKGMAKAKLQPNQILEAVILRHTDEKTMLEIYVLVDGVKTIIKHEMK